jgi:hypothetical protein
VGSSTASETGASTNLLNRLLNKLKSVAVNFWFLQGFLTGVDLKLDGISSDSEYRQI